MMIPKEKKSKRINHFRIVSLFYVKGKIFFSIVARHLANFLVNYNYINTVQKGGISRMPGCIEHTGVVT